MYPLHHYGWSDLRALRSGRYKVIDAPRPELYDIDRDPQRDDQPVLRTAGARRPHDRAAADDGGRFNEDDASLPAADVDPGGARASRGAWLRRVVRRQRLRSAHRARRSQGQDRALQQARHRHRPVEGRDDRTTEAASGRIVALAQRSHSRGPAGHRRLVHAGHAVPAPRRAGKGGRRTSSAR